MKEWNSECCSWSLEVDNAVCVCAFISGSYLVVIKELLIKNEILFVKGIYEMICTCYNIITRSKTKNGSG